MVYVLPSVKFFFSKLNILNILLLRDVVIRTHVIPAIFLIKSYKISKLNKGFLHLYKHYLVYYMLNCISAANKYQNYQTGY
jgi:hypothetical protein